jgi:hypothetical protein
MGTFRVHDTVKDLLVDPRRQPIGRIGVANGRHVHQRLFFQFVSTLGTIPIPPALFHRMIQTRFIVRAEDVSVAPLVKGIRIQFHGHLARYRVKLPPIHRAIIKRAEHFGYCVGKHESCRNIGSYLYSINTNSCIFCALVFRDPGLQGVDLDASDLSTC